jgi:hypothetical protein
MNGRIYDNEAGRFFSADPHIQFPLSTQGFNRYAYVANNPLSYSDPSGFYVDLGAVGKLLDALGDLVLYVGAGSGWGAVVGWLLKVVGGYLQAGGSTEGWLKWLAGTALTIRINFGGAGISTSGGWGRVALSLTAKSVGEGPGGNGAWSIVGALLRAAWDASTAKAPDAQAPDGKLGNASDSVLRIPYADVDLQESLDQMNKSMSQIRLGPDGKVYVIDSNYTNAARDYIYMTIPMQRAAQDPLAEQFGETVLKDGTSWKGYPDPSGKIKAKLCYGSSAAACAKKMQQFSQATQGGPKVRNALANPAKFAYNVHLHPEDDANSELFSYEDMELGFQNNIPVFIGNMNGDLFVFPAGMKPNITGKGIKLCCDK